MLAENPADVAVRPVTADDIATVVEFRTRMFRELGWRDEERLSQVEPLFAAYLAEELERGGCSGFIAENVASDGTVTPAGTVVIVWQRVPPGVRNLAGRQAYLLGMFVEPEWRRRGLARASGRTRGPVRCRARCPAGDAARERSGTPAVRAVGIQGVLGDAALHRAGDPARVGGGRGEHRLDRRHPPHAS